VCVLDEVDRDRAVHATLYVTGVVSDSVCGFRGVRRPAGQCMGASLFAKIV